MVSRVRAPQNTWICSPVVCCVGSGLCYDLSSRSEESCRVCVCVCVSEREREIVASTMGRPGSELSCPGKETKICTPSDWASPRVNCVECWWRSLRTAYQPGDLLETCIECGTMASLVVYLPQSVWRIATEWKVRGSNFDGDKIFPTRPNRYRGPSNHL